MDVLYNYKQHLQALYKQQLQALYKQQLQALYLAFAAATVGRFAISPAGKFLSTHPHIFIPQSGAWMVNIAFRQRQRGNEGVPKRIARPVHENSFDYFRWSIDI